MNVGKKRQSIQEWLANSILIEQFLKTAQQQHETDKNKRRMAFATICQWLLLRRWSVWASPVRVAASRTSLRRTGSVWADSASSFGERELQCIQDCNILWSCLPAATNARNKIRTASVPRERLSTANWLCRLWRSDSRAENSAVPTISESTGCQMFRQGSGDGVSWFSCRRRIDVATRIICTVAISNHDNAALDKKVRLWWLRILCESLGSSQFLIDVEKKQHHSRWMIRTWTFKSKKPSACWAS